MNYEGRRFGDREISSAMEVHSSSNEPNACCQ